MTSLGSRCRYQNSSSERIVVGNELDLGKTELNVAYYINGLVTVLLVRENMKEDKMNCKFRLILADIP